MYSFVGRVDREFMDRTVRAWEDQIAADPENTAGSFYDACLPHCQRIVHGNIPTGDSQVCVAAIRADSEEHASALMVLSHPASPRDGRPLRLLSLYVQPSLNLADREPNIPALAWIAALAITGALGLTYSEFPAEAVKVHTAFPLDAEFMTAVTTALFQSSGLGEQYAVTSHGAWLVVTKK